jgi:hypothetical protein
MATIASGEIGIVDASDIAGIISQATPPESPADGQLWRNTITNALKVYRASLPGWDVVVDNLSIQGLIEALQTGTINNDAFNDLMDAAGALTNFASPNSQATWDNIASSLTFGGEGLTISNKGGDLSTRLALEQLEFWKGKDAAAVLMAVFGVLKTITSPTLQIGSSAQSPKLLLGAGMLEYQAANGNITFRKA